MILKEVLSGLLMLIMYTQRSTVLEITEGVEDLQLRETAMRVAAGAVAKKYLAEHLNIQIHRLFISDRKPIKINSILIKKK